MNKKIEFSDNINPKVFISYSWDNEEHQNWVKSLAIKLKENGVHIILDVWELNKLGKPVAHFMKNSIIDSDRVICIMTPNYKKKTDKLSGGGGYEYSIITDNILRDGIYNKKFIPLLKSGSENDSIPVSLSGRNYIDMKDEMHFEKKFEELIKYIYSEQFNKKPSMGKSLDFNNQNNQNDIPKNKIDFGIEMVYVEGGTFIMGCPDKLGNNCDDDERPAHSVTLSSFSIGKYAVTQEQWKSVMGSNPSFFKNCNDCPVENVSWNDIQIFLKKLNAKIGKKYRLPTEAEWEYAARGGNKSKGYKYSGSNVLSHVAWYLKNSGYKTHKVGEKVPNELGIYDMSGNVYEWCSDWYDEYSMIEQTNPTGPSSGEYRVLRGGNWNFPPKYMLSFHRGYLSPAFSSNSIGFRLALI